MDAIREGRPASAAANAMHEEYELKLALTPEHLARLAHNPLLRSLVHEGTPSRRLVSTYYDTPAGLLRQRAMALRVRRAGRQRTQTLKVKANGATGLQHFREFEAPLESDRPDLTQVDDAELQALFAKAGMAAQIEPVFTTDFARRKFLLRLDDSEIELALDRGKICSGAQSLPISEAELELVSGRPSRLYELALALQDSVPFHIEHRTKAARGYDLALNRGAVAVTGAKPRLSPKIDANQAFGAIARACRDQIQANEAAVMAAEDLEGVHQMRVGIRRLRALLQAFRPVLAVAPAQELTAEFDWLQTELGPARDWDILLTETLPPIMAAVTQDSGLDVLRRGAETARRAAYRRAHAAIRDPRYVRLLLRLNLWLEDGPRAGGPAQDGAESGREPIIPYASRILARRHKRVRKQGRRRNDLGGDDLHKLRIEAKKLRYATEFFCSLFPKRRVAPYLESLVAIQDTLGALHDSAICRGLLEELRLAAALDAKASQPLAERAAGLVAGWQAAVLRERTRRFDKAWRAFRAAARFWV